MSSALKLAERRGDPRVSRALQLLHKILLDRRTGNITVNVKDGFVVGFRFDEIFRLDP